MKYYHSYILLLLISGLSFSLNAQSPGKSKVIAESEIESEIELELKNAKKISQPQATILPARRAYIYMEPTGDVKLDPGNLKGSDPQSILAKQPMNCKLILSVFNPGTIARIHVKLGSAEGKSNFVSQVFNFDQPAAAPFSYARDGKTVVLGLGQYTNMGSCYGEVILEDLNGKRSAPKRFESKD